jgi:hypothetical protein
LGRPGHERLSDKIQVTVVLRLLLHPNRQLDRGELVDPKGITRARFKDWSGMLESLRAWIASDGAAPPD